MSADHPNLALAGSFGAVALDYDRLRSQPPAEALDWLLPSSADAALELGAGTGLLTTMLAAHVPRVTALEPDSRMRAVLMAKEAGIVVLAGHAEEIPVSDASIDVVIAQSAWHWVDEARAVPEVARVLRRGGRFALAWTGTDRSVDWMRTLWAGGVEQAPQGLPRDEAGQRRRYEAHLDHRGHNDFLEPETSLFHWTQPMSKADLVGLATTYSSVIAMDESSRGRHLAGMERYIESQARFAGTDVIDVPMRSYCWRTNRR